MRSRLNKKFAWAALAAVLGAGLAWTLWREQPRAESGAESRITSEAMKRQSPNRRPTSPNGAVVDALLNSLPQRLAEGLSRDEVTAILDRAAAALLEVPRADAVAALIAFLDRGTNAQTGLMFQVESGGKLRSAPSLRVWALDQLGRLDVVSAADYSARIYSNHDSADEWAVALRNQWRQAAPSGQIEPVRRRVLELISDAGWASVPSVGFLEALDLSVATLAWEAVPSFERWLDSSQPTALRGGAWVALDRLTMEVPGDFLPLLVERKEWLRSQPLLRAGLVARADLSVARERMAVERYLQRDDVATSEGKRFLELLPNVSATVSHNLVTTARTPTPQQAARLDRAALAGVREWREQSKFERWAEEFVAAEIRLSESVASAVRGGYLQP